MSLDDLFSKVRMYAVDVHHDDDLKIWFDEFFKCLRKSLDEAVDEEGYGAPHEMEGFIRRVGEWEEVQQVENGCW